MKEFVEKLIGRLEEYPTYSFGVSLLNTQEYIKVSDLIEIVNQLAEECNNGWIPCSERLPSKEGEYLTFVEYDDDEFIAIDEFLCEGILKEWNCTQNYRVIAWMELPEKYQKGE